MTDNADQPVYTEQDKDIVRRGVFGALAYVSAADPGFFATFKESAAGAQVLGRAPQEVQQIMAGGLTLPDAKSPQEFQASIVPNLQAALQLVESKSPAAAQSLREVVLAACQEVANASKGVSSAEQEAVSTVQQALQQGGSLPTLDAAQQQPSQQQPVTFEQPPRL